MGATYTFPNRDDAVKIIDEFLWETDPMAVKRLIDAQPWLLSEYTETELRRMAAALRDKGLHPETATAIEWRADQLGRCRELGVFRGLFGERVAYLAAAQGAPAARDLVRKSPFMLSDAFLECLADTASEFHRGGEQQLATEYAFVWGLLQDCRRLGIDASFDSHSLDPELMTTTFELVLELMRKTAADGRRFIEQHPELLNALAPSMLSSLGQQAERDGDAHTARRVAFWEERLAVARERGIAAAFAEHDA